MWSLTVDVDPEGLQTCHEHVDPQVKLTAFDEVGAGHVPRVGQGRGEDKGRNARKGTQFFKLRQETNARDAMPGQDRCELCVVFTSAPGPPPRRWGFAGAG